MILFIDDQALLTKPIRDILVDIGEYDLINARDVVEAKELLKKCGNDIQLVLLDIMMPLEKGAPNGNDRFGQSTGLRLGKWIRKEYPHIIIWGITVRDDITIQEKEEAGISKIFVKPVDPADLLKQIENKLTLQPEAS